MTRARSALVPFDPEIEATARRLKGQRKRQLLILANLPLSPSSSDSDSEHYDYFAQSEHSEFDEQPVAMANPARKTMAQYEEELLAHRKEAVILPAAAGKIVISPSMAKVIQGGPMFRGLAEEDPAAHLDEFIDLAGVFSLPNVEDDDLKLKLFPHSLADIKPRSGF